MKQTVSILHRYEGYAKGHDPDLHAHSVSFVWKKTTIQTEDTGGKSLKTQHEDIHENHFVSQ